MIVALLVATIRLQRPPAEDVLKLVVNHYQKLKSFTTKISHHADFLTDVKNSTDELKWLAPKRFELTSDHESIPKLICDGRHLTTFIPNIAPISESFNNDSGRTKPWETRGGLLLSILMHGTMAEQLLHPEKSVKIKFDHGSVIHWHDLSVSQIIETITVHNVSEQITYYLSPNYQKLIGTEITNGTDTSWTQYDDQLENIDLPKTLGSLADH